MEKNLFSSDERKMKNKRKINIVRYELLLAFTKGLPIFVPLQSTSE